VLDAAERGEFVLCLSREIVDETRGSLRRKIRTIRRYYAYPDRRIDEYARGLVARAEMAGDLPGLRVVPLDPKDDMVVATAVKAGADYLVTGDRHLLSLDRHGGVLIVGPRRFLDLL
jgi:putative PIN family toxin of toxin-antitoxin system